MSLVLSAEMKSQIEKKGIPLTEAERQLALFKNGIPPLKLARAATAGDGILQIDADTQQKYRNLYEQSIRSGSLKIMKFVPASGAASRMFKSLEYMVNTYEEISQEVLEKDDEHCRFAKTFIENLGHFAFRDSLYKSMKAEGLDPDEHLASSTYKPFISFTLGTPGLGYSNKPKALIEFHRDGQSGKVSTSLEEHFSEAALYAADAEKRAHLHFTVSPEFEADISHVAETIKKRFSSDGFTFEVELSNQQPSTDTLAVDENNEPFLDKEGNMLFRPGGHGALIENLDKLEADVVFIKNIDNVVPDSLKDDTILWKKVLGGLLINLREDVLTATDRLRNSADEDVLQATAALCEQRLNISLPDEFDALTAEEKRSALLELLNRPIRVCGMVKNEGEPGGGPFWIDKPSMPNKLQIVESSQMDMNEPEQQQIVQQATHFNPVDLVCSLTAADGTAFELDRFTDPETAFIASKSYDGRALKALERPGLWNGAMASWITVFVEVPISTFNPVKTVNDLLRPAHQG
ncbi:protein of unknown function (DUF4301) [Cyclonatronum proteinivorum]|uniref:DUF4301 domain-containing protein n=1 Tax=Cyclonatronum proteinivorum TaxID=1457365 RepID=A0A345UIL6_9BACT|nr:DUF4301 family protein [Cyclonatronum proteinivorum]AXJ00318.1 protein of unknown function (DUF4301) [Cyclonatronum proteinivorum]